MTNLKSIQSLIPSLGRQKIIFFILTCLAALYVLYPQLDYEPILTQGDHGRDLYCFKKTYDGAVPYRDYWWQYGPLMPYYYAFFFKIMGVSIQSVLTGEALILLGCGVFIYLTAVTFLMPPMAFLSSVFFMVFHPDFFYTFNHAGGILMLIMVMYSLFHYLVHQRRFYLYAGWLSIVLLSLIRLNLGLSSLAAFLVCLIGEDFLHRKAEWKKRAWFHGIHALTALALTSAVYFCFLQGLSAERVKQSLPYLSSYRYDNNTTIIEAVDFLSRLIWVNFTATLPRILLAASLILAVIRTVFLFTHHQIDRQQKTRILTLLGSLSVFLFFTFHESFVSESIFRLIWIFPVLSMLFMALLETGFKSSKWAYALMLCVFLLSVGRTAVENNRIAQYYKQPINLFEYGKTRMFMANSQWWEHQGNPAADHWAVPRWTSTVMSSANYLQENLKPEETFLALPYDAMYYFLTGKDSPVYHLAFFDFIHISSQEEERMIQNLEEKKVNYILLSNRAYSLEPQLGVIGRDYCPLLARYIFSHFEVTAQFGDWEHPPEFERNHGVRILKRKIML